MIEWKTINGYPNYQVSNSGEIKSIRFNRLLKLSTNSSGYRYVNLISDKIVKSFAVHRIVMDHFGSLKPGENYIVDHIDEDKLNNNSHNLAWTTIQENTKKYYNNYKKKEEVLRLFREGKTQKEIKESVDLSLYTIRQTIFESIKNT